VKILGISDHIISGAALIEDGRVLAAVNEERLVRKKLVMGFPWKSIEAVLALTNTKPEEVVHVAVASVRGHFLKDYVPFDRGLFGVDRGLIKGLFFAVGAKLSPLREKVPILEKLYYDLRKPVYAKRRETVQEVLRNRFGLQCPVEFIVHHFAHACSAYYTSGYGDALVVTMDASGDGASSHVYSVVGGRWRHLHQVPAFDSLGSYYAYITHIAGFKAGKHEGKITGLAAYGTPAYREILARFIRYHDGTITNVGNVFFTEAVKKLGAALPDDWSREDLAATIQAVSEEIAQRYIGFWREKTGHAHVALAGGVFGNVKINQRIHEIPGVESLFIHPAMSDEGLAVGAALALRYQKAADPAKLDTRALRHVYLGPEYPEAALRRALEGADVPHRRYEGVEREIARRISEGYVVARFSGKMEYGPRALGNRSILYRPDDASANDWLNKNLNRTEFMPFAPVTLADDADANYNGLDGARDAARFMTITFDCTPDMRKRCAGVVHVDGTARPQLIRREDNPSYYAILTHFKAMTGLSSIVNTSFNIHEEPIVCSPEDAVRAFQLGHLDCLAMGPFIAENPAAEARLQARRKG